MKSAIFWLTSFVICSNILNVLYVFWFSEYFAGFEYFVTDWLESFVERTQTFPVTWRHSICQSALMENEKVNVWECSILSIQRAIDKEAEVEWTQFWASFIGPRSNHCQELPNSLTDDLLTLDWFDLRIHWCICWKRWKINKYENMRIMQNMQELQKMHNNQKMLNMQIMKNQSYQINATKPKIPNQICQTKPANPNLPNQTCQTKHSQPSLPKQTYQTQPTKLNRPTWICL